MIEPTSPESDVKGESEAFQKGYLDRAYGRGFNNPYSDEEQKNQYRLGYQEAACGYDGG